MVSSELHPEISSSPASLDLWCRPLGPPIHLPFHTMGYDWETHKPEIIELYIAKGHTLEDTMRIIAAEYPKFSGARFADTLTFDVESSS